MLGLALVTDIHYGPDNVAVKGSVAPMLLEEALGALAQKSPDLLVDLGDRLSDVNPETDKKHLQELAALFSTRDYPREHLLGNHDLLSKDVQEALLAGSLSNRSRDVAGWHLVFLDTFNHTIEGALTKQTLEWLHQDLSASTLPAIVFSHQPLDGKPLLGNRFFETDFAEHAHPANHAKARQIMEQSGNVKLAINGHTHWNHHLIEGGIHYLSLQSLVAYKDAAATQPAAAYGFLSLRGTQLEFEIFGHDLFKVSLELSL